MLHMIGESRQSVTTVIAIRDDPPYRPSSAEPSPKRSRILFGFRSCHDESQIPHSAVSAVSAVVTILMGMG